MSLYIYFYTHHYLILLLLLEEKKKKKDKIGVHVLHTIIIKIGPIEYYIKIQPQQSPPFDSVKSNASFDLPSCSLFIRRISRTTS